MFRFLYIIKNIFIYRRVLKEYLDLTKFNKKIPKSLESVLELTEEMLHLSSITTLILDFDGVLSNHGAKEIIPEIKPWFSKIYNNFNGKIYILSNNPNNIRKEYFDKFWPNVTFIIPKKKKPYPDGILQIKNYSGEDYKSMLIIDDRLGTGILAAVMNNIKAVFINKPIVNFSYHPILEFIFSFFRLIEKLIIKIF